ncbi:hypothetical protein PM082_018390 [Marasmius tenuissimus]|nr:hypothetical protein PM082_018390 [Marasmius tenuissimus]
MKVFHRVQWFLDLADLFIPSHPQRHRQRQSLRATFWRVFGTRSRISTSQLFFSLKNIQTHSHFALFELLSPSLRKSEVARGRLGLDELLNPIESDGDDDGDGNVDGKGTEKKRLFQQDETGEEDGIVGDSDEEEDNEVVGRKEKSTNVGISHTATRARDVN